MHRVVLCLALLVCSAGAYAACWRLANGGIVETSSRSTPPERGAVRVDCPRATAPHTPIPSFGTAPQQASRAPKDECQPYYGKGYCTDYIKQRIGHRPSGDPKTWPLSPVSRVKEGAAVVFGGVTSSGHVAYVERVIRNAAGNPSELVISEMNYAKGTKAGTPKSCLVTNNFGVVTPRTVPVDRSISGVWLP